MAIDRVGAVVFALLGIMQPAAAAELTPATLRAFHQYIQQAESRVRDRIQGRWNFLWVDDSPDLKQLVLEGQVVTRNWNGSNPGIPGGLIHDWAGAVFVPGTTLKRTITLVQDYNRHKDIYRPEVVDSRVLSHNGNDYRIYLRLLKKKVLTVVLNTEHEVHYYPLDQTRCHSRSYTTRIAEVQDPGRPGERELPVGDDHGFLWLLYSYWRFQERDGGVYIECEAISLTRDVPAGLGWLIEPIIRNLPRESLASTLRLTREALKN